MGDKIDRASPRTITSHPLDDPEIVAEIKEWTILILSRTGSGKVVIEIDFHDWKSKGVRCGGMTGRKHE